MSIKLISPKKSVNSAFLKLPVPCEKMEQFKSALVNLLNKRDAKKDEEYHKNELQAFLKGIFNPAYSVHVDRPIDLAIFNGNDTTAKPAVIIEMKSPTNAAEMFSEQQPNTKALQELVYYFLLEYVHLGNREIKYLVISNFDEYYFFDIKDFIRYFANKSKPVYDQFLKFVSKQTSGNKTSDFYNDIAKPAIDDFLGSCDFSVVHFSLEDAVKAVEKNDDKKLVALYKMLSPEGLLAKPFANDSNSLDRNFYAELLHIIGLEEVKEDKGGKKVIQRKKLANRDKASLLESAIYQLEDDFANKEECEAMALRLCITWVNRLLFLKLVESQILMYQKGDASYRFMSTDKIANFDELNIFFFKVLGKKIEDRDEDVLKRYPNVPYLNSSLFEPTEDEKHLKIRGIPDAQMEVFNKTVLKDEHGKRAKGRLPNLDYIFKFLDAYNFASDAQGGVTSTSKTLINASVLGLIFEKINGYKDGSFFTPGFITDYMARDVLERTVVQKFNEVKGWSCKNLREIEDNIGKDDVPEANKIVDEIRIADVAVGSGHFLVSALNRMLAIKSELNIFCDAEGNRINKKKWELKVDNDELSVIDDDGEPFEYKPGNETLQRIQEALFNEKRRIIENCLFGVDLNPNSVNICRLRLWIELLKNAYYTKESGYKQLQTLPNIDINIKVGDSLLSKYPVQNGHVVLDFLQKEDKADKKNGLAAKLKEYRKNVQDYKAGGTSYNKQQLRLNIAGLKSQLKEPPSIDLFGNVVKNNDIDFSNSLEWMFEFPEILDDEGRFTGFDAIIGNPPYVQLQSNNGLLGNLYEQRNYNTFFKQGDLYCLFIERAHSLLRNNGEFGFIVPNTWLQSLSFSPIRLFLTSHFRWNRIALTHKVFADATVDTHCLLFTKSKEQKDCEICRISADGSISQLHAIKKDAISQTEEIINIEINPKSLFVIEKIQALSKPLAECLTVCCGVKPFQKGKGIPAQTKEIVEEKPYVKEGDKPGEEWSPLMRGSLMHRYTNLWDNNYWILYGKWLAEPRSPKIFEEKEKIIIRQTGDSIIATIIDAGIICRDNLNICIPKNDTINLKFILGVLNSKLTDFYYTYINPEKGEALAQVKKTHVEMLRIPNATEEQQNEISDLVEKALCRHKENVDADISAITAEIDKLVYKLYDLTEEEIGVVESV
jgi:hypothetical protein